MPFTGYQVQRRDVQQKSQGKLDEKLDERKIIRAVITDLSGSDTGDMVWANEATRKVWIREVGTSAVSQVYCYNITPDKLGLAVIVGYEIGCNVREVLRSDKDFLAQTNTDGRSYESTSLRDIQAGGRFNLWVESKMIQPLATFPDETGLTVNVVGGDYPYLGQRVTFPGQQSIDLDQNPNVGEHYLAGLYLDSANALQVVYGASVAIADDPPEPAWPDGAFQLSVVRINDTQTSIAMTISSDATNDVFDRRMVFGDENANAILIQDEGVDQGLANTLDFVGGGVVVSVAAGLATITISAAGWPFAQILTVSLTDPDANYPTLAAAVAVANNQTILLDSETYMITGQSLANTITLTGVLGQTVISGSVASGATLTVANISTFLRFLRVSHTGGGTTSGAILTDQDGTFLERLIIRKTAGAPTTGYGVHITGGASSGTYLLDNDISVTSGTNRYGVLIDTAASITVIDGGEYNSTTADILVNHASATVLLKGPRLRGGGLTVTAGTVTGWYIDANGFTVNVTGLNFDVTKGLQGGVWREATGGRRVRETSLATAITNASAGDTIYLYPGTYPAITVNKAIAIVGTSPKECIITQSTNDTPTITVAAANITLMNLTIDNTGGGSGAEAIFNDQAGFLAINCIISKSAGAPTNGAAVNINGGTSTFRDCTASSASGTSKYAYSIGAGVVTLQGGSASGATADALTVSGATLTILETLLSGGGINTLSGGAVQVKAEPNNLLYHSMHHDDWQEGTTFNDIADATTYAGNLWLALHNGQAPDVSGLAGGSTSDYKRACRTTFDSAASQNGFVQFLTNEDTVGLRGKTLSVSAEIWGSSVANIALNVLIWTSTADSFTKDVVTTWNNGSAHTLATNWAFGVTSIAIPIGTSEGVRYRTNAIPIPTNANNIAVFISTWDNEASTDVWTFANVQLEIGPVATVFVPMQLLSTELPRVNQFYWKTFDLTTTPAQGTTTVGAMRTQAITAGATAVRAPQITFPVRMRTTPTVTFFSTVSANAEARDATAGADCSATAAGAPARWGFGINCTGNAATAVGNVIQVQATADARF